MKLPKKLWLKCIMVVASMLFGFLIYTYWNKTKKEKPLCPKCNIIMIDIDILRADALPCYGYKRNTAPNVCALSDRSQLFINNYAQSVWTLPSIISTISSLYPIFHGVQETYRDTLDPRIPTLAQSLKNNGYKTFYFGFTSPYVINDANGGTKGYDVVQNTEVEGWPKTILGLLETKQPFFAHFYTARLHMPYLLKNESQLMETLRRPAGFPISQSEFSDLVGRYLYQNYEKVFTPLAISDRPDLFTNINTSDNSALLEYYWALSNTADPKRINNDGWLARYDSYIGMIKKDEQLARPYVRLLYDSVLSVLDRDIAQTLLMLSSPGIAQKTIVVFYSDHGEEFGEHGDYGHPDSLYNELVKTPLIIYIPGVSPQKIRGVTQNIDIFPTLTGLSGVDTPKTLQGSSLVPLIQYKPHTNFQFAISQSGSDEAAIQSNAWKLIVNNFKNPSEETELYNLLDDPVEKNDVSKAYPGIKKILLSELFKSLRL